MPGRQCASESEERANSKQQEQEQEEDEAGGRRRTSVFFPKNIPLNIFLGKPKHLFLGTVTPDMLSLAEENYLKSIYHLSDAGKNPVSTNALADSMNNKAASVTEMIKRLASKKVVTYEKYHGVNLLEAGKRAALKVIRKHRLWETFLVDKLSFHWDEVHEVAEQLEHIQSPLLIEKLDAFLGFPSVDPHGHSIPDKDGRIKEVKQVTLADFPVGKKGVVRSVQDGSPKFLQYLSKIGIRIGVSVKILEKLEFDGSQEVLIDRKERMFISKEASQNLLISESK